MPASQEGPARRPSRSPRRDEMSPISTDPQGFLPQPARFAAGASAAATVPPAASRANWEHKRVFSVIAAKLDSYRSLSFFLLANAASEAPLNSKMWTTLLARVIGATVRPDAFDRKRKGNEEKFRPETRGTGTQTERSYRARSLLNEPTLLSFSVSERSHLRGYQARGGATGLRCLCSWNK